MAESEGEVWYSLNRVISPVIYITDRPSEYFYCFLVLSVARFGVSTCFGVSCYLLSVKMMLSSVKVAE